ncbi:hypothetical protein EKO27_g12090, partial [Xylaria grammica]
EENQRAASAAAAAASRTTVDTKLAEARSLESQISAKAAQIEALETRIADSEGRNEKEKDSRVHADLKAVERLEAEMDLLATKIETLRVEADEEFARGLAEREDEWGAWE